MTHHLRFSIPLTILSLTASSLVQTSAAIDSQVLTHHEKGETAFTPTMSMKASKPLGYGFGIFGFGLATKNFGEVYTGPTYKPASCLSLSIGAVLESSGRFRTGSSIWLGGKPGFALAVFEVNAAGDKWYRAMLALTPTKALGLGGFTQRFAGTGPYLQVKIENSLLPVTFWSAPILHDHESTSDNKLNHLAGIRGEF